MNVWEKLSCGSALRGRYVRVLVVDLPASLAVNGQLREKKQDQMRGNEDAPRGPVAARRFPVAVLLLLILSTLKEYSADETPMDQTEI